MRLSNSSLVEQADEMWAAMVRSSHDAIIVLSTDYQVDLAEYLTAVLTKVQQYDHGRHGDDTALLHIA